MQVANARGLFKPFQFDIAFHIETRDLICTVKSNYWFLSAD